MPVSPNSFIVRTPATGENVTDVAACTSLKLTLASRAATGPCPSSRWSARPEAEVVHPD
jgi:hypothetical protein